MHGGHQRMTDFVVRDNLLFFGTNHRALTLVASNNHLNGFLQIGLLYHLTLQLDSAQSALVHDVGQLGAAGAGGGASQGLVVDIISHFYITGMHP